MRLYDSRRDYYDGALLAYDNSPEPVWRRTETVIEVPMPPGADGGEHAPVVALVRRVLDATRPLLFARRIVRGQVRRDPQPNFVLLLSCGRAYLVAWAYILGPIGSGLAHYEGVLPSALGVAWPDEGVDIGPDIHRQYASPLIRVDHHRGTPAASNVDNARRSPGGFAEITVNPNLADQRKKNRSDFDPCGFVGRFPPGPLAREIERYLSNELASATDPPVTTGGDEVVRDAKGFDEWSFKRHHSQNKPRKQR